MFTNIEVYFPVKHAEEAGPGELSWDFFVGFRMEEVHHGTLGEVTDVDTSTINTLFVVDYQGGDEKQYEQHGEQYGQSVQLGYAQRDDILKGILVRNRQSVLELDVTPKCFSSFLFHTSSVSSKAIKPSGTRRVYHRH